MTDISAPLIVEVLNSERGGAGLFTLYQDFAVLTTTFGWIVVTKGYTTDLATIPRIVRWLLPQAGHSARAAVVHDWLLHKDVSHTIAAKVFNEILKAGGTGPIRRWIMVPAVWLFTIKAP